MSYRVINNKNFTQRENHSWGQEIRKGRLRKQFERAEISKAQTRLSLPTAISLFDLYTGQPRHCPMRRELLLFPLVMRKLRITGGKQLSQYQMWAVCANEVRTQALWPGREPLNRLKSPWRTDKLSTWRWGSAKCVREGTRRKRLVTMVRKPFRI